MMMRKTQEAFKNNEFESITNSNTSTTKKGEKREIVTFKRERESDREWGG